MSEHFPRLPEHEPTRDGSHRVGMENTIIAQRMNAYPDSEMEQVMIALEALRTAGANGLNVMQWSNLVADISEISGSLHFGPMSQVKDIFHDMITKVEDKVAPGVRYVWTGYDEEASSIIQQVGITHDAIKIMTDLPSFTDGSLAGAFMTYLYLQRHEAASFARTMIETMNGSLERTSSGYRMRREPVVTREDNMQMFRDLVDSIKGGGGQTL